MINWIGTAGASANFLKRLARSLMIGTAFLAANVAWAVSNVGFKATDLVDVTPGQDLWRYAYVVSGPLEAFGSLKLLFPYASFTNLASATSDANLSLLDTQPDTGLQADGLVTLTPTVNLPGAGTALFAVDFVWLGTGAPGSQVFEWSDAAGGFGGTGTTTLIGPVSNVPEPMPLVLACLGLATLTFARRQRQRA